MNKIDDKKIKSTIEEMLRLMSVNFDSIEFTEDESMASSKFMIKTADSSLLIGIRGANLQALNHVVKKIVSSDEEEDSQRFFIDVNGYQERLEEELRNKARVMSERARSFKVDIELEPMSSYERMVVHSSLQDLPDIKTESRGVGRERRVVIKYVEKGE